MSPKRHILTSEIVEFVRDVYGLGARDVGPLAGRAHAEAIVYRVDAPDGAYFLKLTPGRRRSLSPLARYLADAGIAQVLAPLRTLDGQLSAALGDQRASLYPFIEGANAFITPLNERQWIELGSVVRAIHDMHLPPSVSKVIRREVYADVWRSKTRRYLTAVPTEHLDDSAARALIRFLASNRARLMMLVEHAEQLAPAVRRKQLPQVPCHGDLHAGNVLTHGAGPPMIVDWDDPVLAPRERDLMFVGAGIGSAWNRDEESAAFYRGYGAVDVDAEALAYYRCDRIVEDIAVFCDQILPIGADRSVDRELLLSKVVTIFDPDDVVEMAERAFASI